MFGKYFKKNKPEPKLYENSLFFIQYDGHPSVSTLSCTCLHGRRRCTGAARIAELADRLPELCSVG